MWHARKRREMHADLVAEPETKRQRKETRCRLEDNIKVDLTGIRLVEMCWIHTSQGVERQGAVVNTVMNI
jgi:hypothetical protein